MSKLIDCKTGWRNVEFPDDLLEKCAEGGIQVLEHDCWWNDCSCADYDLEDVQKRADKFGLYLQSVHLALGTELDLSLNDTKERAIKVIKSQLDHAGAAGLKYGVIHASAEPIADDERDERMKIAADSIVGLCDYAQKNGVILCVEDLPRSCLCNDIDEMQKLLSNDDRLKVCFDVNHLLKCSHRDFVSAFGDKIVTTHISDYDFIDDCHWLPGEGKIDWSELADLLEEADYKGAFLYECDVDAKFGKSLNLGYDAFRKMHENIAARREPLFGLR